MKTVKFLSLVGGLLLITFVSNAQALKIDVSKELQAYSKQVITELESISSERKSVLEEIGGYLIDKLTSQNTYSVLFVCTHNSRRSHIADIWFKYALLYYGVDQFESYSGGLEETAFHPNAINALKRAGFTAAYSNKIKNSVVSISPKNYPVWKMQSKEYTHKINPRSNFIAMMVCSDADKSCPAVEGADKRFSLPYDDPRYFDNTPAQDAKYDEKVKEIAKEMFYLASYMKNQLIIKKEAKK